MEPYSHPYTINWIKKNPSIKVTNFCHLPISIGKIHQDFRTCYVVNMNACHILFGRPWPNDVNATHKIKENIYLFLWKGKRVAMRQIPPTPKPAKQEEPKFIFIRNGGDSLVDSKDTKQGFILVVKEKVSTTIETFEKVDKSLNEYKEVWTRQASWCITSHGRKSTSWYIYFP